MMGDGWRRGYESCEKQCCAGGRLILMWLSYLPGCGEKDEGNEMAELLQLDCLPKGPHFHESLRIC